MMRSCRQQGHQQASEDQEIRLIRKMIPRLRKQIETCDDVYEKQKYQDRLDKYNQKLRQKKCMSIITEENSDDSEGDVDLLLSRSTLPPPPAPSTFVFGALSPGPPTPGSPSPMWGSRRKRIVGGRKVVSP